MKIFSFRIYAKDGNDELIDAESEFHARLVYSILTHERINQALIHPSKAALALNVDHVEQLT
jgi:hypothetical protein